MYISPNYILHVHVTLYSGTFVSRFQYISHIRFTLTIYFSHTLHTCDLSYISHIRLTLPERYYVTVNVLQYYGTPYLHHLDHLLLFDTAILVNVVETKGHAQLVFRSRRSCYVYCLYHGKS